MSRVSPPAGDPIRALWLAFAFLAAAYLGTAACFIRWLGQHDLGEALLYGGASFGGSLLLILAVIRFVSDREA